MGEVLVHDHTLDEHRVFQTPAFLSLHLDQLEIHVPRLQVSNAHHRVNGNLGKLAVATVHAEAGKKSAYQ